jgi:hypothetical protein
VATAGYDLSNGTYSGNSFDFSSQDGQAWGIAFNDNGTKMYMVGNLSGYLYEYDLSTPFDVSTASYGSVSFDTSSEDARPNSVSFNDDGTKMYVLGSNNDRVYQYTLTTAYDISTASYASKNFSVASQSLNGRFTVLANNGTKLYYLANTELIYQYTLSTAYDISTASYDSKTFNLSSQDTDNHGFGFNDDGTKLYAVGVTDGEVSQYSLSTAYDISTASYDSVSFSAASEDIYPFTLAINNDGTKMYVVGLDSNTVYQYSTATPATITYDSALQWSGGTAPTAPAIGETDVLTFNTTDGGTTYQAVQAIDGAK